MCKVSLCRVDEEAGKHELLELIPLKLYLLDTFSARGPGGTPSSTRRAKVSPLCRDSFLPPERELFIDNLLVR